MKDYIQNDLQYVIDRSLSIYENAIKTNEMILNGVDKMYVLENQIKLTATPLRFCHSVEGVTEIVDLWKLSFKNHPKMIELFNTII